MRKEKARKILENFLQEMENENKSRHTIINYRSDIACFLENCPEDLENLTLDSLRSHIDGLGSKSLTTKARHISSLKKFLNWCYKMDYIQNNPIYKIEYTKIRTLNNLKTISKNSIEEVICSIKIFNSDSSVDINNLKYRIIFTLILEGGLKISEALNLRAEDIELDTETILVNSFNKRRVPLYSSVSMKLLKLYINETRIKSGLIFKGGDNKDKSLSYQAVNHFWRRYCAKVGANIRLQQLRDYYAQDLLRRGFDINVVSKLLGHRNIQAAAKYL